MHKCLLVARLSSLVLRSALTRARQALKHGADALSEMYLIRLWLSRSEKIALQGQGSNTPKQCTVAGQPLAKKPSQNAR